jgi:CheY-like chemotaxis protein
MNSFKDFIIIDDDIINNKLCRKIIEKVYPEAQITDFTSAKDGLDFIIEKYTAPGDEKVILLLDISMPIMNAWEFLEVFDTLNQDIKNRIKVHILSSSINKNDMMRAQNNSNVEYYLIKPLTKESIKLIVNVLNKKLGLDIPE